MIYFKNHQITPVLTIKNLFYADEGPLPVHGNTPVILGL